MITLFSVINFVGFIQSLNSFYAAIFWMVAKTFSSAEKSKRSHIYIMYYGYVLVIAHILKINV